MRRPLYNDSPEAVALREQAVLFGTFVGDEPEDIDDKPGQGRNAALLRAALAYARKVERSPWVKPDSPCPRCGKRALARRHSDSSGMYRCRCGTSRFVGRRSRPAEPPRG